MFFVIASNSAREIAITINSVIQFDSCDQEPLLEVIQDYFTSNTEYFSDSDSENSDDQEIETETGMMIG